MWKKGHMRNWWTKKLIEKTCKQGCMLHFCCQLHSAYLAMTRERQKSAVVITEHVIIFNEMGIMTKIQAFQGQILYEAAQIWSTLSIVLLLYNFLHHLRGTKCFFTTCAFFVEWLWGLGRYSSMTFIKMIILSSFNQPYVISKLHDFFLLWNIKGGMLNHVFTTLFHIMKVNENSVQTTIQVS